MDDATPPPDPAAELVLGLVRDAFQYGRAMERVRAAGFALVPVKDALVAVAELEPELGPELTAAMEHVTELIGCLDRAVVFLEARYDVQVDGRFANPTPPKEEPQ